MGDERLEYIEIFSPPKDEHKKLNWFFNAFCQDTFVYGRLYKKIYRLMDMPNTGIYDKMT
jgi:hypothetical protein